jgi:hypothetical protein
MNRTIQTKFSNIIRKQEDIENKRLKVYQNLFFNNIKNFVDNTFVVTKTLFTEKEWESLIKDFLLNAYSRTPYFKDISNEFYNFHKYKLEKHISELMDYELSELRLYIKDADFSINYKLNTNDLFKISDLVEIQHYEYPVHLIHSDYKIEQKDTFLITYRNIDNKVNFIEINEMTFLLIFEIENKNLIDIQKEFNIPNLNFIVSTLKNLLEKGIITKK